MIYNLKHRIIISALVIWLRCFFVSFFTEREDDKMKKSKKKSKRKANHISEKFEYDIATNEIISYYTKWLEFSNITEGELLSNRVNKKISYFKDFYSDGRIFLEIRFSDLPLGEPFVSSSKENNDLFVLDLQLLLLYIAERLDQANRNDLPNNFSTNEIDYFFKFTKLYLLSAFN